MYTYKIFDFLVKENQILVHLLCGNSAWLTCSLDITTVCDLTQPFDSCSRFLSLATGGAGVKTNPEAAPEDSQTRQLDAGAELLNRYLVQVAHQLSDTGAIGHVMDNVRPFNKG